MSDKIVIKPDTITVIITGSTLTGIQSEGGYIDFYDQTSGTTALFKTLKAGSGMGLVDHGTYIEVSSTLTGATGFVTNSDFTGYTASTNSTISGINDDITYLSGQTDLKLNISDYEIYTGNTDIALGLLETKSNFNSFTGNNDIRITNIESDISYISGQTDLKLNISDYLSFTGDNDTRITNVESDITYLSGETDLKLNISDYETFTGNNDTRITNVESDITYISGQTDLKLNISDYEIYTGNTDTALGLLETKSNFNLFTGTTAPATYALKSAITTYTGTTAPATYALKSAITTYTGTTAPGLYETKSNFNSYTGATATALLAKADKLATILLKGNYTVQSTDNNDIIRVTGTSTITLPTGITIGCQVVIINSGSGVVSLAAGSSATLNTKSSNKKLANQYGAATAVVVTTNTWTAFGDLST